MNTILKSFYYLVYGNDMATLNIYNKPPPQIANETEDISNQTDQNLNFNTDRPPIFYDNVRNNQPKISVQHLEFTKKQKIKILKALLMKEIIIQIIKNIILQLLPNLLNIVNISNLYIINNSRVKIIK